MSIRGLGIESYQLFPGEEVQPVPQSFGSHVAAPPEGRRELSGGFGNHADLPRIVTTSTSPPIDNEPSSSSPSHAGFFSRHRSPSPDAPRLDRPHKVTDSGLQETRKLLSHLLDRLEHRPMAPDIFSKYLPAAQGIQSHFKRPSLDALKGSAANLSIGMGIERKGLEAQWDTESVVELLGQLLGLLSLAKKQSLDLFRADSLEHFLSTSPVSPGHNSSPTPKRRGRLSSMSPRGAQSSPKQPIQAGSLHGPLLLKRMTGSLESLIANDCLHQVNHPRPGLPPNSLQAMVLELASFLLVAVVNNQEQTSQILRAVTAAFYSFPSSMVERLLAWFEGAVRVSLFELDKLRRGISAADSWADPFAPPSASASIPVLSLSVAPESASSVEDQSGWRQWASPISGRNSHPPQHQGILSTHTAGLESSQYYIASVFAPLIQAVTSTVNLSLAPLTTIHRVHRLLAEVIRAKPDASLDLLEVVAYGTADASYSAWAMLATFWPKAVGHVVVAKPLPLSTYEVDLYRWEIGRELTPPRADAGHEYMTWRSDGEDCGRCSAPVVGFSITCVLCQEVVHLDCYSPQDQMVPLAPVLGQASLTPSAIKFSHVRRPSQAVSDVADGRMTNPTQRILGQHHLMLANVFTLALCAACQHPLWGLTGQAYSCGAGCHRLFHPACVDLSSSISCNRVKAKVTIRSETFRQSYEDHYKDILFSDTDLESKSVDELAILYGTLWTQLELLENGLAHSSLVIQSKLGDRIGSDDLDLPQTVRYCSELLQRGVQASSALTDFQMACPSDSLTERYMHNRAFLSYVTALMRSPASHPQGSQTGNAGLLQVAGSLPPEWDEPTPAYETLPLEVIRGVLRHDFGVSDTRLAALLLSHLHHTGYLQQSSLEVLLAADADDSTTCSFPLPTLLDASTSVEMLLSAIEVSLERLDLAINEHGFVLLVKRAWPSALCSEEALQRLAEAVTRWIIEEGVQLLVGIEQYASNHRPIPGLRVPPKGSGAISTTSVAQYKADRRLLLTRYAVPWLRALHDLDPTRYTSMIYDIIKCLSVDFGETAVPVELAQQCLGCIARLDEAQVTFSASPELLIAWLRDLGELASQNVSFKQLPRLLQNSTRADATTTAFWAYTRSLLSNSPAGYSQALRWLRVLAQSGVNLPYDVLLLLREHLCRGGTKELSAAGCDELLDFMTALGHSQFGRPREEILGLSAPVVYRWLESFRGDINESRHAVLNQMLVVILTAYGLLGANIPVELQVTRQDTSMNSELSHVTEADPLPVDLEMVEGLASLLSSVEVAVPIARFLLALFSKSSNVADRDSLICTLSATVCKDLWMLQRTHLWQDVFLDLLLVFVAKADQALLAAIEADGDSGVPWLWRLVVDLVERDARESSRPWRKAVVDILLLFLSYISTSQISAEREALRRSILPTHLAFMTTCFEDALIRSRLVDRVDLLNKLDQQHALFTSAPIVGWATLEALSAEQTLDIKELQTKTDSIDALRLNQTVRAGVVGLALSSMSSGVKLPGSYHKRLIAQAKHAFEGLADESQRDALTLLAPSVRVCMDSPIRIVIRENSENSLGTLLLGAPLIEDVFGLVAMIDFASLSFSLQRCVLDCAHATVFKHTIYEEKAHTVEALQAIARITKLDISVDIRLQALSVLETALDRCPSGVFKRALPEMFAVLAEVIASEPLPSHDATVARKARSLLRVLHEMLGEGGLYLTLLKERPVSEDGPSLWDVLRLVHQSDFLPSSPHFKSDAAIVELILADVFNGLLKATRKTSDVNVVLGSALSVVTSTGEVAAKSAENFGEFLSKLARHVADWAPNEFNPNPVLAICAKFVVLSSSPALEILSSQSASFLMLALARFDVDADILERLLQCTSGNLEHPLWLATQAQLVAAARGSPVTDPTLLTLLQTLVGKADRELDNAEVIRLLLEISPGCLGILLRPAINNKAPGNLLAASKTAARVILMSDEHDGNTLALVTEALGRQAVAVQLRVFSFLSAAALEGGSAKQKERLVALLPVYGRVVGLAYKACADFLQSPGRLSEGAELLTRAFLVSRAALILASTPGPAGLISMYWLRVWPDLERLLYISLRDECKTSPLCATLHACFLDLVSFMAAYSPVLILSHGEGLRIMSTILESEKLASPAKVKRALAALQTTIQEAPLVLEDLQADLAATERLLAVRGMS